MNKIIFITLCCYSFSSFASLKLDLYRGDASVGYQQIAKEVTGSTSITMSTKPNIVTSESFRDPAKVSPWLWIRSSQVPQLLSEKDFDLSEWLKRGGMLVLLHDGNRSEEAQASTKALDQLKDAVAKSSLASGEWRVVPTDHSLLRSFYLLKSLPTCDGLVWSEFRRHDRPFVLSIPYDLVSGVSDSAGSDPCLDKIPRDIMKRLVVNIAMLAMTTHYKSDQIHLPEILKRLR